MMDHSALPASTRQREQHMLQPPRMTKDGLEVSVHIAPKALIRELKFIFRDVSILNKYYIMYNNAVVTEYWAMQ